ncbi:FeoB-associated Cys-rich membrane protein [bacterium]|nr:FeoB-associated Cys-rich membrane protein [bacterium]
MKTKTILIAASSLLFVGIVGFLVARQMNPKSDASCSGGCGNCGALAANCQAAEIKSEVEAQPLSATSVAPDVSHKIIAYYFHSTNRCATCLKIEKYSHESIENGFADALKDGRLEWQMVNTDFEENEHYVNDFQLYTKSLVLVEMQDGKQIRWKNCEKVWELLHDKDAFQSYVQNEVRGFLKAI